MINTILRFIMHYLIRYIYYNKRLIIASLCVVLSLSLGVILFKYSPNDNSFLYYSSEGKTVTTTFGAIGAHCAALLTFLFGGASLLFVGLLLFIAYILLFNRSWWFEWDRIFAMICMFFIVASLFSGYAVDPLYSQCPGGYCGIVLWKLVIRFFDSIAATIILSGFLLTTIIISIRLSYTVLFCYTQSTLQVLYERRYYFYPFYYFLKCIIHFIFYPFKATYNYMFRLGTGEFLIEDDESIILFEHGNNEDVKNIRDDDFWHAYWNKPTGDDEIHEGKMVKDERVAPSQSIIQNKESNHKKSTHPYQLPRLDIFINQRDAQEDAMMMSELEMRAKILEEKLERFGICGKVVAIKCGPVVTLFEYQPHIDTKLSKIVALEDDLAMALQALSIRILAPIPGRSLVGFEVANAKRKKVMLGSVIQSKEFRSNHGSLPLILGCDTVGNDVIVDLAKMPHLLIAGSTGSGKSVALNSMLVSLLCQRTPDELRLILIDPKRLEFASYDDIAHLLFPIITDPKQAILALKWVVKEMERRYDYIKQGAVRNIFDYNAWAVQEGLETLPFIVIIIDELSDLMITAGRDIEDLIVRITQMARAAGIYMLVATQRPSVDVITGLIKVNFPSRISFRVTSKVDSRTILDCSGAEKLLGRGDMLFLDAGSSLLKRVHGVYVSDAEIEHLVSYIRKQAEPEYCELTEEFAGTVNLLEGDDHLYHDVVAFLEGIDEVSISLLQRRFRVGYNRSARIIEMLESEGIIAPSDGGKMRKVIHR